MSVSFIVIPAVAAVGWPVLIPIMIAAGAALGYRALRENAAGGTEPKLDSLGVNLSIENGNSVQTGMARGESFTLVKGDIKAVFHRDGRGAVGVHVSGKSLTDDQLREAGAELIDRVKQQFAYSKIMAELEERGFEVVSQQSEADQSIRIQVRRWA